MCKTFWCLTPLVGYLVAASPLPANAGWDDVYVAYGGRPTVILYAQYPVGPVRWRVYPRYYQTLYWPAGYRYPGQFWGSTSCGGVWPDRLCPMR